MKNRGQAGFTLVELMIVVGILGLLAAIATTASIHAREASRERICINNLRQIDGAKNQWALEYGHDSGMECDMSDVLGYLRNMEPRCPVGQAPYTPNAVATSPECTGPAAARHNAAYNPVP